MVSIHHTAAADMNKLLLAVGKSTKDDPEWKTIFTLALKKRPSILSQTHKRETDVQEDILEIGVLLKNLNRDKM